MVTQDFFQAEHISQEMAKIVSLIRALRVKSFSIDQTLLEIEAEVKPLRNNESTHSYTDSFQVEYIR